MLGAQHGCCPLASWRGVRFYLLILLILLELLGRTFALCFWCWFILDGKMGYESTSVTA